MTASLKKLSKLLFLTKGTGRTMVQAALRFILDTDGVTSVIPGARNRTQLADNAGAASKSALSAEERSRAISIAHAAGFEF
jgi:aryl-alcohol dehydrogenase-like predicted oxidoreductase